MWLHLCCKDHLKITKDTIDSYKKKAVLVGVLTVQESVVHMKKVVLLKDLTTEEGCYQDCKPPWHTYGSGLFHGFPGITLCQSPCRALGPIKLWVMCSSRHPLRIPVDVRGLWHRDSLFGDRTREYFHSNGYLETTLILSLNALYRAISKFVWHCDLQRTAL